MTLSTFAGKSLTWCLNKNLETEVYNEKQESVRIIFILFDPLAGLPNLLLSILARPLRYQMIEGMTNMASELPQYRYIDSTNLHFCNQTLPALSLPAKLLLELGSSASALLGPDTFTACHRSILPAK